MLNPNDREALARMLAAETSKRAAWPYMAVAVSNAAEARKISITEHLQRPSGTWGHNSDGHWASTVWDRAGESTRQEALAYSGKFLAGQTEAPVDSAGIRSFYEVNEHGVKHDPGPFLRKNPELELAAEVDGWQFYRRHGKKTIVPGVPNAVTGGGSGIVALIIIVWLASGRF